jgi:hypothetical protein
MRILERDLSYSWTIDSLRDLRVSGHLNYYAITDNSRMCSTYRHHARRILFKWLNRKSQRRSYTWKGYLMGGVAKDEYPQRPESAS